MNCSSPLPASAAPAPSDPAADRPGRCACCGAVPAAEDVEQDRAMLHRLAAAGFELAMAVQSQALRRTSEKYDEVPAQPGGDPGLAFTRLSRMVRQTLALKAKLLADHEARQRRSAADQAALDAAAEKRAAEAAKRAEALQDERRRRNKAKAKRILTEVLQHGEHPEDAEKLLTDLEERLEDNDEYGELLDLPTGRFVALVSRDMSVFPKWEHWIGEDWAADAAATPVAPAWPDDEDDDEPEEDSQPPPGTSGSDPP